MSVVVGYVPTPAGTAALDSAIAQARTLETKLVVVIAPTGRSLADWRQHHAEEAAVLAEKMSASGLEHTVLEPGADNEPAEEILAAAEEYQAELIVIGLRRRTPVGKLIMGKYGSACSFGSVLPSAGGEGVDLACRRRSSRGPCCPAWYPRYSGRMKRSPVPMSQSLQSGLIAGAVGTVTLNIVTYADMALRGRAASQMPAKAANKMAEEAGVSLGDEKTAGSRKQGLGALLGYATGLGVGIGYGMLRSRVNIPLPVAAVGLGAAAMAGSDIPMTALGLTDPRKWPASSWAMDIVPHLAYGAAAAATYRAMTR